MKKKLAGLCGLLTAATFMTAALPPVAPVAHAGIDWGKVIGDVITGAAKTGNNGSNSSGSGSPSPGIGNLSNQKHAHPNLTNDEKLFILAIEKNDIGTAQSVLDTGIDIEMVFKTNYQGLGDFQNTPFGIAILNNNRDMMQFLLEHGANINGFYDYDNNYRSYFAYAGRYVKKDLLEYLHNWGANINGADSLNNENSLDKMYSYGQFNSNRFECAKYLLENGINPDNIPKHGSPILSIAVERSDYQMIDLLANYGANLNIRDKQGRSVLDIALNKKDLQLYKYVQDVIARGQQPSKYRTVKEAAQAEAKANKAKKDEVTAFNKNLSKAIYSYNDVIKSFDKDTETMVKGSQKDRIDKANKMLAKLNDGLKLIDSNTVSLSNCKAEEKELLLSWQDNTKSAFLKEKELLEIFTSDQELTTDDIQKASDLQKEATEFGKVANDKKKAAEELLKMKL